MRQTILRGLLIVSLPWIFLNAGAAQAVGLQRDTLDIGGALRYNLFVTDFGGNLTTNDRQYTFDTWRLNIEAAKSGINFDFEYRFYPTYSTHFVHHGWLGTSINDQITVKTGVLKVPFGLLPYASNSWWFSTAYYAGLEDDYDMGFTLEYDMTRWNVQLGYFMQAEPNGPAALEYDGIQVADNTARYSYDVVEAANQSNSERSQFNGRFSYAWDHADGYTTEFGLSAEYGRLYNEVLDDFGDHQAFAVHLNGTYGRFNVKSQILHYEYDAFNDLGRPLDTVQMGAYGFGTYSVAAKATMYIFGLSYDVPTDELFLDTLTLYNDFTLVDKSNSNFNSTLQNVLGISFGIGDVYAYLDVASGQNHPWLNDTFGTGLGAGAANPRWNTRFNLNIGYYF